MIYVICSLLIIYGLFSVIKPEKAARFRYFFVVKNGEVSDFAVMKEVFIGILIIIGGCILLFLNYLVPLHLEDLLSHPRTNT